MSRYAVFYATRQDSLDLLLYLEGRAPLVYVRWGHYDSPSAPTYMTAADVPDLGTAEHGRKGDNRYLVLPTRATLKFYKHRGPGGPEYEPQTRGNSPYVFFHSGGVFRGKCLIAGEVWTAFENRDVGRRAADIGNHGVVEAGQVPCADEARRRAGKDRLDRAQARFFGRDQGAVTAHHHHWHVDAARLQETFAGAD